jgi:hypothetical protein
MRDLTILAGRRTDARDHPAAAAPPLWHYRRSALTALGWVEMLDLKLVTFADVGLSDDSSDRAVWRQARQLGMILLTDNRNNDGPDSLEQTLRDGRTDQSLPVLMWATPNG